MFKLVMAFLILIVVLTSVASAEHLTGTWQGTGDGATYYIRHVGTEIFWFGESDPINPAFANVAHGKLHQGHITLSWADVPKGSIIQGGILFVRVVNANRLVLIRGTGGFANGEWTRTP